MKVLDKLAIYQTTGITSSSRQTALYAMKQI